MTRRISTCYIVDVLWLRQHCAERQRDKGVGIDGYYGT